MADIEKIRAQLKETSKGKLKYDDRSWNQIFNETNKSPGLHLSPFTIKNSSRIEFRNQKQREDTDFKIYFSPVEDKSKQKTSKQQTVKNAVAKQNVDLPTQRKVVERLTMPPVSPEHYTQEIDKEYKESLEMLSKLRLQKMDTVVRQLDTQMQNNLDHVAAHSEARIHARRSEVQLHQASNNHSKEIAEFNSNRAQRMQITQQKTQQTEAQLQALKDKRDRLEEIKQAVNQRKINIGKISEEVKLVFGNVINEYKSKKDLFDLPASYKQSVNQCFSMYNQLTSAMRAAMELTDVIELDKMMPSILQQSQLIKDEATRCGVILKKMEEDKQVAAAAEQKRKLEEEDLQKRKLAEEAKQKAESAAKQQVSGQPPVTASESAGVAPTSTATKTAPTQQQQQQQRTVAIPTVQEAVPEIVPLYDLMQKDLSMFTSKEAFKQYLILRKLVADTEKVHEPLSKSKEKDCKSFKFDLVKVVNTQVNAISDESPKHLLEKILKLHALLTGKEVLFSGKKVSTKGDKTALAFVKDLTAKKLVLQGQSQVASSFKTAFPIAAVCAGLWALFPDLGDLLLGHFYAKCPYLAPLYLPKTEKVSAAEYCRILGYNVSDGQVEEEDKYLNKLSGYVRLYAAIIQMDMPPDLAGRGHPHGLEHGWVWFTRILNLDPLPSVTATVIYDFLEVTGHALMKRFGKQFQKLLVVLVNDLMPKIIAVTPPDAKAGATRLKMFLDRCIKEQSIKPPDGLLTQRWWVTGR